MNKHTKKRRIIFDNRNGEYTLPNGEDMPKAVRNNNPVNIVFNPNNDWLGQLGQDGRFVVFDNPENGFRAAAKLLKNYERLHGINTISGIIRRFAPAHENPTDSYITYISEQLDTPPDQPMDIESNLFPLLSALTRFEAGGNFYTDKQIAEGIAAA